MYFIISCIAVIPMVIVGTWLLIRCIKAIITPDKPEETKK